MHFPDLISNPEFWSALFGALAAFLLGVVATWWTGTKQKQAAANLTLISLAQMYSLAENLRYQLFVTEPIDFKNATGTNPFTFQIRALVGLGSEQPRLRLDDLGYLADSHDPDILNRLLSVERMFQSMMELVRRHADLQGLLQNRLVQIDPTGTQQIPLQDLPGAVGIKLLCEIDDTVKGLERGLPETKDGLFAVGKQLRDVLRHQFLLRRFLGFSPELARQSVDYAPPDSHPAFWRRVVRWCNDFLRKRRRWIWQSERKAVSEPTPTPPPIVRFPPRPWLDK
jgi:hypothetical protein